MRRAATLISNIRYPIPNTYPSIPILLLTSVLRLYRLDFQPLWWDEGYSVFFAGQPVPQLLSATAADIHPPLYYLVLRAWSAVASFSPWSSRFLSVAASTLCVAVLYVLGFRLLSRRAGLIAAGILALSPFQIHHAQEARMYALVTLLALLSTYLLVRGVGRDGISPYQSAGLWIWYALVTVLTLLTHYYAVFIPVFQGVYVMFRRREAMRRWITAMAAGVVVLYAPWLAMIAGELPRRTAGKVAAEADPARSPLLFLGRYLSTVTVGYGVSGPAVALTAGVVVLLILLGFIGRRRGAELPLLYLIVPLGGGLLLNQVFPFEAFPRLLAYAAPAAYLLMAAGVLGLFRWRIIGVAAAGLVLMGLGLPYPSLYAERRQPGEDYRPIVATIDDLAMPSDLVILDFPWQAGYFRSYSHSHVDWWIAPGSAWAADPAQMARDLDRVRREQRRLWYVAEAGLGSRRGQNIEGYLVDHAYLALDEWHGMSRLLLFGTQSAGPVWPLDVTFGQHIRLVSIAVPESIRAGDVLPVQLNWQATGSAEVRLKVFAHLLDAAGQIVAQHDTEPVAGLRPTDTWRADEFVTDRLGVLIPKDVPAGPYQIELGLYSPVTGQRLPVFQAGRPAGDRLVSGPVTVRN